MAGPHSRCRTNWSPPLSLTFLIIMDADSHFLDSLLSGFLRQGSFRLAGGGTSEEYLDLLSLFLHPTAGPLVAAVAARTLLKSDQRVDCLAAPVLAGVPLACQVAWIARTSPQRPNWPVLAVRTEAKTHGTARRVEGLDNLYTGRTPACVLVDGVLTSGGSLLSALDALREEPAALVPSRRLEVVGVLVVVDRQAGGAEAVRKRGLPFTALTTLERVRAAARTHAAATAERTAGRGILS